MIAKELGAIDKTWSFPEWQYNVKVLVDIKGFLGYQNMDVILIKQEIENKFKLNELLKDDFNVKIIPENNLISDIFHPKTNSLLQLNHFDSIQSPQILLLQMNDQQLMRLSKLALKQDFEIKLYRDRFDLAHLIKKLLIVNSNNPECDPITLISLMTWERLPLPEQDCKLVFDHFKSIENMFKVSKDALEYSLNSIKISDRSKQSIKTFLTAEHDYYID